MKKTYVYAENCQGLGGKEVSNADLESRPESNDYVTVQFTESAWDYYYNLKSTFGWRVADLIRKELGWSEWWINFGFLESNLPDEIDLYEYEIDIESALADEFPGAEITVVHQKGQGCKPFACKTQFVRKSDGFELDREIIDNIAQNVFLNLPVPN